MADDIWGIGFKTADSIASKMGYEKNDLRRCKSGIIYTLNQLANEGHVYAEEEQLIKAALELLEADEAPIREALANMVQAEDLKVEGEAIYLPPFYFAEVGTTNRLLNLLRESEKDLFAK
ncbi:helicase, RecD/TraA family, partial [gut metagenome]